ncbi:glycosyl transferase [Candidatus Gracilibacteria bacterium]|nr:MAG: glycosyl transferase [Candidatus Gracilibacteria bacterium]PIE85260.1 MAG: glycosyl transferase [Candidatus Gracilibacteria bacterium]
MKNKKIAIVSDWIKDWGGAEIVLEQLMEIFPNADIYCSVFWQQKNPIFEGRNIKTSFIQKIPILNKSHKLALFFRPLAFESFDFSSYDIVISLSSAESKGVITKPETFHVCYCHTPTRYFWSHYHEYLSMMEFGFLNFLGRFFMPKIVHFLREWDFCASKRPDIFISNSKNTKKRIKKYYKRDSKVIYPCLDIDKVPFSKEKKEYYFYTGRCVPYKKFDLLVDAFNKNGRRLVIATNTKNNLCKKLIKKSNNNILWYTNISEKDINKLHSHAKAFIFPPEEDFGLVPIFAMASGTPVIAYGKGGALETVIDGETGIFFENQTSNSLNKAIEKFDFMSFDYEKIRNYSKKFDKKIFKKEFLKIFD